MSDEKLLALSKVWHERGNKWPDAMWSLAADELDTVLDELSAVTPVELRLVTVWDGWLTNGNMEAVDEEWMDETEAIVNAIRERAALASTPRPETGGALGVATGTEQGCPKCRVNWLDPATALTHVCTEETLDA